VGSRTVVDNSAIVAQREAIERELGDALALVETARAKQRILQRYRCKHPNERITSHMGETCHHCYDCGNCP
jgi:hypothetical protein